MSFPFENELIFETPPEGLPVGWRGQVHVCKGQGRGSGNNMMLIVLTFFLPSLVLWNMRELFSCCVNTEHGEEIICTSIQYTWCKFAILHVYCCCLPIFILLSFLTYHGHSAIHVL